MYKPNIWVIDDDTYEVNDFDEYLKEVYGYVHL
jgi:hypothetical protein